MEHYLKQCDKEFMKMAMLKHETTFRQQVYELHRLYRQQKQLMRDVRSTNKELKRQRDSILSRPPNHHNKTLRTLNLQLSAEKYIVTTKDDHESLLELTLAIGCTKKKRGGMPRASDSNDSLCSSIEYSGPINHEWVPQRGTERPYFAVARRDKLRMCPRSIVQCLSPSMI